MRDPLDLMAEAQATPTLIPSSDSGPVDVATDPVGTTPARLFGTWMRLGDGTWGARIIANTMPAIGQLVTLERSNGKRSTHRIVDARLVSPGTYKAKIQAPELPYTETITRVERFPLVPGPLASNERQAIPVVVTTEQPTVKHAAPRDIKPLREPVAFKTQYDGARVKVGALNNANLVAGAAAEGHGILTGFSGRGSMTRGTLLQTLSLAGFPEDWAPQPKSAHAHAGRVLNALNQSGYVCRADTKRRNKREVANSDEAAFAALVAHDAKLDAAGDSRKHYAADAAMDEAGGAQEVLPTWAARWVVAIGKNRSSELGAEFGSVVMIATLGQDGELWLEATDEAMARRVREDFQARVKAEEYAAADVSAWIKSVLVHKFRAAQLGGNWYCRKRYAGDAERFLTTFSRVWGENWMLPALPIATTEQLRVGIVNSLISDANAVLAEYRTKLDEAKRTAEVDGEAFENRIGSRAAESLYAKVVMLGERAMSFGMVLGESYVVRLRTELATIAEEIAQSVNGEADFDQRFERAAGELDLDEEGVA